MAPRRMLKFLQCSLRAGLPAPLDSHPPQVPNSPQIARNPEFSMPSPPGWPRDPAGTSSASRFLSSSHATSLDTHLTLHVGHGASLLQRGPPILAWAPNSSSSSFKLRPQTQVLVASTLRRAPNLQVAPFPPPTSPLTRPFPAGKTPRRSRRGSRGARRAPPGPPRLG